MPTTRTRTTAQHLEDLAEDLTRRLGIPFRPNSKGGIAFREPLRITSWSVPLVFDGHAAWDHGSLVPTDFVGHVLWAALRSTSGRDDSRPYWHCNLSEHGCTAILEHLGGEDAGGGWVIGEDVLLERPAAAASPAPEPTTPRRRSRKVA
ncbi:MAG TPA: hypothetical protein VHT97_00175 [Acidimicrobiales bacterium]|nr:hypothetical protein [Acidimicrobiales bacterium]